MLYCISTLDHASRENPLQKGDLAHTAPEGARGRGRLRPRKLSGPA